MCVCPRCKRQGCQEWDSNPRLQGRLRPERSALDRSAILTAAVRSTALASQASGAHARASGLDATGRSPGLARGWSRRVAQAAGPLRLARSQRVESSRRGDAAGRQSGSRSRSGSPQPSTRDRPASLSRGLGRRGMAGCPARMGKGSSEQHGGAPGLRVRVLVPRPGPGGLRFAVECRAPGGRWRRRRLWVVRGVVDGPPSVCGSVHGPR